MINKPIFGGIDKIDELHEEYKFDSVIISITSNIMVRASIFEKIKGKDYEIINAVHPRAYIISQTEIGMGNIIGAFVHIGFGTVIWDNNLISTNCDLEHHNEIGSHIVFGPGVSTSGGVCIGSRCSLGAGVAIEPGITICSDVAIASGSAIFSDIPVPTTIKSKHRI